MAYPKSSVVETPILQELYAVGGAEDVRFLYERLVPYFPQLNDLEIQKIKSENQSEWRKIVQRAGRELDEKGLLKRERGFWTITETGRSAVENERVDYQVAKSEDDELTHSVIQKMLVEIARSLGYEAQTEFEYYDVVWRENAKSPRLSHVFEVQSKGNIDSAFAKLKRAYAAQRTKPFLVLSSETDLKRAEKSLTREFHELSSELVILTFPQVKLAHQNLAKIAEILRELLLK